VAAVTIAGMERRLARRDVLRMGVTAAGTLAMAACTGGGPGPRPGATGETPAADFRMGVVLPAGGLGDAIRAGMRLSLQQIGGQAAGRRIVEFGADEGSGDPAVALASLRRLVEGDGVELVAGFATSAAALAVRDYVDQRRLPTLVANAGAVALSRARRSPYVYRTSYTNWQLGQPFGSVLVSRGIRRLALVSAGDSDGVETAAAVKETYTGRVLVEAHAPSGGDYGALMEQLSDTGPDGVCALLSGADAVAFLKQARAHLGGVPLTGWGFLVEPDVLAALGDPAPLGAVTALHWSRALSTPANRAFTADYQRAYGRPPDVYAVQGYDTARVVAAALGAVRGRTADPQAFVRAIAGVDFASPRGRFRFAAPSNSVMDNLYVRQLVADPHGGTAERIVATLRDVADPGR
jgi:branched-chain amino acid transport system substrate-binding protein